MSLALFWILAAAILAVGEVMTLGFYLAPFAGGALLAGLVAALGSGGAVSIAVFIVVSLVLLLFVRPIARSHRHTPAPLRTGTAALIGQSGIVVEQVVNQEAIGAVKIGGELWTARAYDDDEVIEVGTRVQVLEIRGATALVG